jgi:HD-GYP domain-containing protein (c-di-GMP phosphodiesterase class II)
LVPGRISPAAPAEVAEAWRTRLVATQALTAAHVAATAFLGAPDHDALVIGLLVCDLGMLEVPVDVLAQPGALTPAQTRLIEQHPQRGAEWLGSQTAIDGRILAGVREHHERPDGTGYPAGKRTLDPLAARMAACATYAALLTARPHRDGRDPQAALTESLVAAEHGQLDRNAAQALRALSFYPRGSVVELDDGSLGVVVAARVESGPVVALLTDATGHRLPGPQVEDLSVAPERSVRRALSVTDRRRRLGALFPQFA